MSERKIHPGAIAGFLPSEEEIHFALQDPSFAERIEGREFAQWRDRKSVAEWLYYQDKLKEIHRTRTLAMYESFINTHGLSNEQQIVLRQTLQAIFPKHPTPGNQVYVKIL